METVTKIKTEITLILSVKEALWLKHLTQNQMWDDESSEDAEIRANFFEGLPSFDKLRNL